MTECEDKENRLVKTVSGSFVRSAPRRFMRKPGGRVGQVVLTDAC